MTAPANNHSKPPKGDSSTAPANGSTPSPTVENKEGLFGLHQDGIRHQMMQDLIANVFASRKEWINRSLDPRRDIDDECGYPKNPTVEQYQTLYNRDAIAARVVQVLAKESWRVQPSVYEVETLDVETEFEAAWKELGRQLRGEYSWYQDEKGSVVWDYLARADQISGIGHYGVILIGLNDGLDLREPAKGVREVGSLPSNTPPVPGNKEDTRLPWQVDPTAHPTLNAPVLPGTNYPVYNLSVTKSPATFSDKDRKILYLRVFPESQARITKYETNITSPRFGQPVEYQLTVNDPRHPITGEGTALRNDLVVHWTRVVHITPETLESSEVHARPRMEAVLNRILDLQKIYGASGEGYWKCAFTILSFETHPSLDSDFEVDKADLKSQYLRFINGLDRSFTMEGMSMKSIAPALLDPTPYVNAHIEAICIEIDVPKRIFMGSERGELASTQDDAKWKAKLRQRQTGYVSCRVVMPFVDRLIMLGVLPEPEGYSIDWPDMATQTKSEQADVMYKRVQAVAHWITSGADKIIPPKEFLTLYDSLTEAEADAVIKAAKTYIEEKMEQEAKEMKQRNALSMDHQEQMIERGLAADPTKPMPSPTGAGGKNPTATPGSPVSKDMSFKK